MKTAGNFRLGNLQNANAGQNLTHGLNEQQKRAVELGWGPALIVAGAGSGKTTVLTHRIAYLMLALEQKATSLLAATFTNKAAGEMQQRLENTVTASLIKGLTIGTFHSICARILRREIECFVSPEGWSWKNNFVIFDEKDSQSILKETISQLNLDEKSFAPKEVLRAISSLKNDGYTVSQFTAEAENYREVKLAEIFAHYQKQLAKNNALDFDDLIMTTICLLRQNLSTLVLYRQRYRHILVDEFQDTNHAQYQLIKLLALQGSAAAGMSTLSNEELNSTSAWHERSLTVVGDVDQSIYSWRKADFRIILGFEQDFKGAELIKLEDNYRSTGNILQIANSIIENNSERIKKVLRCNKGPGKKSRCYEAIDEFDEACFVAEQLKKSLAAGVPLSRSVLLYRTNAQSRAIEEVLVRSNIPYTIIGATRFYDRMEVKDVLAYLKLVYNEQDSQSFNRIINTPKRGFGKATLEKLSLYAAEKDISLLEAALQSYKVVNISARMAKGLAAFAQAVRRWQDMSRLMSVSQLTEAILQECKYLQQLEEEASSAFDEVAHGRIENVREFLAVIKEFENMADEPTLGSFLMRISLVSDLDAVKTGEEAVTLMTLHSAKGLEFHTVFLMGLEEGLFPHVRSFNSPSSLEEERRLMYVGVTRAKEELYLTYSRKRMSYAGNMANHMAPSRFLSEISQECLAGWQEERRTESTYFPQVVHNQPRSRQQSFVEKPYYTEEQSPKEVQPPVFERLKIGDVVMHNKFGIGTVIGVLGDPDRELYNVSFESAGKRLLDPHFAKLIKLDSR